MSLDAKNEKSPDNGRIINELNKPAVKEKKGVKMKFQKLYNPRENILLKALNKQRKISQVSYDKIQVTNVSLKEANEKLHNYKLANKGEFEMAVEAEVSRRVNEMCQPLGKAIQLNLKNVVCMLEGLKDMKTLVSSLSKSTNLNKPKSVECMQGYRLTPKAAVVERRRHIVHPMVKGHVLQPFMINIPRVSMRGQQTCILNNVAPSRKKQNEEMLSNCTERRESLPEAGETRVSSGALECVLDGSMKRKRRRTTYGSRRKQSLCSKLVGNSYPNSSTEGNSCEDITNEVASAINSPPKKEDPLEGPSWLYNGRRRKIGQNRKEILDRIKKGNKAPLEYFVYIDSSSDTETDNKCEQTPKKGRKRRKKIETMKKKAAANTICPVKCKKISNCKQLDVRPSLTVSCKSPGPQVSSCDVGSRIKLKVGTSPCVPNRTIVMTSPVRKSFIRRDCSVVLKREEDDFGICPFRTDDSEPPSDKENVPPVTEPEVASAVDEIKLRGMDVVIEDIMKNQYLTNQKKGISKQMKENSKIIPSIVRIHKKEIVRNVIKAKRKVNTINDDNKQNNTFKKSNLIIKSENKNFIVSNCSTSPKSDSLNEEIDQLTFPCVTNDVPDFQEMELDSLLI